MNNKILFYTFFAFFVFMHNLYGMESELLRGARMVIGGRVCDEIESKFKTFAQRMNITDRPTGYHCFFNGSELLYAVLSGIQPNIFQQCLQNQPGDLGIFFVEASPEQLQSPSFKEFCVAQRNRLGARILVLEK